MSLTRNQIQQQRTTDKIHPRNRTDGFICDDLQRRRSNLQHLKSVITLSILSLSHPSSDLLNGKIQSRSVSAKVNAQKLPDW